MTKFLTQETPAKVMSLLSLSLASMFFLFAVTLSNASFSQVQNPLPDPFAATNITRVLDVASNSYSNFLYANLINPTQAEYAFVAGNVAYVGQNAGYEIAELSSPIYASASQGQAAGAAAELVATK